MKTLKNINLIAIAFSLALASSLAFADTRIGLVDKQVLGQDSLYAKNVHEKMKKEFSARQETLISKEKDLMTKFEALERDKDVIAEAERTKRERELAKMRQSLQEESEAFQQDVMRAQEKEGAAFEKILSEVLSDIAKEEKLDLIVQQQITLFSNRKADYTYKALQALDKRYRDSGKK